MPPTPIDSLSSDAMEAVAARELVALINVCLAVPDSIDAHACDEVGRLLYPHVMRLRAQYATAEDGVSVPPWFSAYDAALLASDDDCYAWLGKSLSDARSNHHAPFVILRDTVQREVDWQPLPHAGNIIHLRTLFHFDDVECRILELAACAARVCTALDYVCVERPAARVRRALAAAIARPVEDVAHALQPRGRLDRSGLLNAGGSQSGAFTDQLTLSAMGRQLLATPWATVEALLAAVLEPITPDRAPPLRRPALDAQEKTLRAVLDTSWAIGEPGINILLYGERGCGKSAFARHLVTSGNRPAYAIPCEIKDMQCSAPVARLARLDAAQRLLTHAAPANLLVDDAEDLLSEGHAESHASNAHDAIGSRAWMMSALRTNACPIVWIANRIDDLDPAYLPHFTMCIHVDTPDRDTRLQVAQQHLHPVDVTTTVMACVAQRPEFYPALHSASARMVRLADGKAGTQDDLVMHHLNSHAKARQLPPIGVPAAVATAFDTAYLQLEGRFNAQQVLDALVRARAGTVLMSGPPGTGKTQLARTIAERLGYELLTYTASDINRKWFGESEQAVARMFAACKPAHQVIFLDEAETMLGARESATHRGAEAVTAEFLRQLDGFGGVFLCATNHGCQIDGALMRRFTFRLTFKPLNGGQRANLLKEMLALPRAASLSCAAARALDRLDGLTPGDFVNVRKRFALIGLVPTVGDWLEELQQEWRAKPGGSLAMPMGFA